MAYRSAVTIALFGNLMMSLPFMDLLWHTEVDSKVAVIILTWFISAATGMYSWIKLVLSKGSS